jgi:hypothetical protein
MKTEVWIANSVYVLVAIVRKWLHMGQSPYTNLQILSVTVFEKKLLLKIITMDENANLRAEPDN